MAAAGISSQQRLFFALWPPVAAAGSMVERARALALAGRAVPREQLHVTLAFHGPCDAARRRQLIAAADAIVEPAFDLAFDRLGYFRRPRIAWFGLSCVPAPLRRLADQLSPERVERRRFVPHITVVRNAEPAAEQAIDRIVWRAHELALVESGGRATPGTYRTLARWPLGRGSGSARL